MRLRIWARGVLVTVAGGGIIKHWSPLYKSESPSQVSFSDRHFTNMIIPDTGSDDSDKISVYGIGTGACRPLAEHLPFL